MTEETLFQTGVDSTWKAVKGSERYPAGLDTSTARQGKGLEGLGRKSLGREGNWAKERLDKYAGELRGS